MELEKYNLGDLLNEWKRNEIWINNFLCGWNDTSLARFSFGLRFVTFAFLTDVLIRADDLRLAVVGMSMFAGASSRIQCREQLTNGSFHSVAPFYTGQVLIDSRLQYDLLWVGKENLDYHCRTNFLLENWISAERTGPVTQQ